MQINKVEAKELKKDFQTTSKNDEWYTPNYVIEYLRRKYEIELDPCASKETAKADIYYTSEDDGLTKEWDKVTFCNPPYTSIQDWIKKAYEEHKKYGKIIIMLIPVRSDTKYWHEYIFGKAKVVFIRGRISFINQEGKAVTGTNFASAFVIFGEEGIDFVDREQMKLEAKCK